MSDIEYSVITSDVIKSFDCTVNSEIIARFLIFAKRSFVKIKSSRNGETTLRFTDVGNRAPVANFKHRTHVHL